MILLNRLFQNQTFNRNRPTKKSNFSADLRKTSAAVIAITSLFIKLPWPEGSERTWNGLPSLHEIDCQLRYNTRFISISLDIYRLNFFIFAEFISVIGVVSSVYNQTFSKIEIHM